MRSTDLPTAFAVIATVLVGTPASAGLLDDQAPKGSVAEVFPKVDPAAAGIDVGALDRLRKRAEATGSDAVVIVKDGRLVADWDFGRPRGPIEAMSATKSIVGLAVGRLIDAGKIKSLDQPVGDFYPEWRQGRKRKVTIRHLLTHTSGLGDEPDQTVYDSPDFVRFALAAELNDDPGTKFSYSNRGVNLLAGIVQKASGTRMDRYIGEEIFGPMGITDFHWSLDDAGNPHGHAGLQISAIDMAKVGQLVLDEGEWRGRRIVSREWIRASGRPTPKLAPGYGLLWWIEPTPAKMSWAVDDVTVAYFKRHGMTARSLERLEALRGKTLDGSAFWDAVRPIVREDEVLKTKLPALNKDPLPPKAATSPDGPPRAISAAGYLGQFLTILPASRIVAVRQRRSGPDVDPKKMEGYFGEFREMLEALAPAPAPARED